MTDQTGLMKLLNDARGGKEAKKERDRLQVLVAELKVAMEEQQEEHEKQVGSLEEKIKYLERGLVTLSDDLNGAKGEKRAQALLTMFGWGREALVDFLKYPL